MYFVGIDLAWGERNPTGVAILDADGSLIHVSAQTTDETITAALAPYREEPVLVAIDAPLVVTNPTGNRPCEAALNRDFARFDAGAHPANTGKPEFAGTPRGARVAKALGLDINPTSGRARRAIEVYPHPATVVLFGLGRTLKYKQRTGRSRAELREALLTLVAHIEGLADADPAMVVTEHAGWRELVARVRSARRKSELRVAEDQIDAVLCAYVARFSVAHPERTTTYGDLDTGYIVTPTLPEGLTPTPRRRKAGAGAAAKTGVGEPGVGEPAASTGKPGASIGEPATDKRAAIGAGEPAARARVVGAATPATPAPGGATTPAPVIEAGATGASGTTANADVAAPNAPSAPAAGDGDPVRRAVQAYASQRPALVRITAEYVALITALLDEAGINYLTVTGRTKSVESFAGKAARTVDGRPAFPDPLRQITDQIGVRVVTYDLSDVQTVVDLLADQLVLLGDRDMGLETAREGRFGYSSRHVLVTLDATRATAPEHADLRDRTASVQIRTVLQHAWAEFEHDIRYKGTLPEEYAPDLNRRFTLAAGLLDLADREFSAIRDRLHESVTDQEPQADEEDPRISAQDLAAYLAGRFTDAGWSRTDHYAWVSGLLLELGVTSLLELGDVLRSVDSAAISERMGYRYPPGAVRRLDDALLEVFGDRYLGLHGNAKRVDALRARLDKLRG
ncbi:DUF429 domain-containing protein [Georgenia sp. SYP-B2076]|uniref:DUF429 domain-containing protein n=1 Tax=Georgenia sp. SYP-B2076 TaxID=2495881 RepID=UPI001F0BE5DF|nr:DUF429 domain-containing protein [Georgenia sp. SYP-B2076]